MFAKITHIHTYVMLCQKQLTVNQPVKMYTVNSNIGFFDKTDLISLLVTLLHATILRTHILNLLNSQLGNYLFCTITCSPAGHFHYRKAKIPARLHGMDYLYYKTINLLIIPVCVYVCLNCRYREAKEDKEERR